MFPTLATSAIGSLWPAVQDSNYPGVAASRRARGNPIAQAASMFPQPGMSPQDRVNEGHGSFGRFDDAFSQFPKAGASDGLIPKFIEMMKNRAATDAGAPKAAAPGAPPMAGPPMGAGASMASGVPSQAEMDASTARWAGTPQNNPALRPMGSNNSGQRLPWQGGPFAGMLDNAYEAGGQPNAGLIPKFVNMMGNM